MFSKPVYMNRDDTRSIRGLLFVILLIMGSIFIVPAHATRIYKSIDADGNVTYSSTPPADAKQTKKMDVPTNYDIGSTPKDTSNLDAIKAAAKELEADRLKREDEREQARKKSLEESQKPAEKPPEKVIHYYPTYPPYYYPGRPRPPRPPHPGPRPPPREPKPAPLPQRPPR